MKSKPIPCQSNELSDRLAEIRSRGGFVYAMDTMVGSNGGYALHVNCGQVAERKDVPDFRRGSSDTRVAPQASAMLRQSAARMV